MTSMYSFLCVKRASDDWTSSGYLSEMITACTQPVRGSAPGSQAEMNCNKLNLSHDIVQIKDDISLDRVTDLHTSSDTQVCAASVTTAEKEMLRRSILPPVSS